MPFTRQQIIDIAVEEIKNEIAKNAIENDTTTGTLYVDLIKGKDILADVSYTVSINRLAGCLSDDYDVPNDPDTFEVSVEWAETGLLYSTKGNPLHNITEAINKALKA